MTDHIIKSRDGNTYDLTKLTTPFGLLPRDVQEAIRAWPHGVKRWQIDAVWTTSLPVFYTTSTYRCLPAPTVTEHVLWWLGWLGGSEATFTRQRYGGETHRVTIRYTGKTLPFGEYTGPDGAVFIVEEVK